MGFFKTSIISLLMLFFMASFSNCSSTKESNKVTMKRLQDKAPIAFGETYYQHWVAGIKGGGSGINLFLLAKDTSIQLDTAYFRGMKTKIEVTQLGYVARFKTEANQKEDLIMSSDQKAEYGNKLPKKEGFPFTLKDNACIISYKDDETIKYFEIQNLKEKPREEYPSAPPRH